MTGFHTLSLSPPLLQSLDVLGFTDMTPVQAHALPDMLQGRDVIAQARTGSGKTLAFGLALLSRVEVRARRAQALVLCPTRELADQVSAEVRRLARFIPNLKVVTLCGGVPVRTQTPSLEHAPHVVVGTPGRILDHLRRGSLELSGLRTWVLDEADRMLDMGFADSIAEVAEQIPPDRQTLLFSATFPEDIRAMSGRFQRTPAEVTVDTGPAQHGIEQHFFDVEQEHKRDVLAELLQRHRFESALVFCHTRDDVRDVAADLHARGWSVCALHGEMEQRARDEVMVLFAHKSCSVLVATDVAARGLDVKKLAAVISYELPNDPDTYLHRVGRTGRAGETGVALSLVARRERARVQAIEQQLGVTVRWTKPPVAAPSSDAVGPAPLAPMVTLVLDGGKQDKLRAGDVLGALTGDVGLPGAAVGKIDVMAQRTYVAVRREDGAAALAGLQRHKIKGRVFRARRLDV